MSESIEKIFHNLDSVFMTANFGLNLLLNGDPTAVPTGVRNVLTFGRTLTNTLQRLRSHISNFDEWYVPYMEQMEKDPLMKYLYNLRNNVVKEGKMPLSTKTIITELNSNMLRSLPKPPNATSFFIGDSNGGSGWEIILPSGIKEKFYINLPWDTVRTSIHFANIPEIHLGKNVPNITVSEACDLYLQYLKYLVDEAKDKFL